MHTEGAIFHLIFAEEITNFGISPLKKVEPIHTKDKLHGVPLKHPFRNEEFTCFPADT